MGRLQLKLFTNKKSWNSVRRDTTFFYLCDIVEKIWKADEFLWRQKELSICAVTAEKKKLVLFQWGKLSRANAQEKMATSRTLELLIANLKIKFGGKIYER